MVEKLGIERSIIAQLGNLLYKNYGTTMAGLRVWLLSFSFFGSSFISVKKVGSKRIIKYLFYPFVGYWL